MTTQDPEYWVDRLQTKDDRERYRVLREWAEHPAARSQVGEVARYLAALSESNPSGRPAVNDEALALAVARGRVPREALRNPMQLQTVLESLAPEGYRSTVPIREQTRHELDALLQPKVRPRSSKGFGIASGWAAALATAAVLAGVLWTAPAGVGWAQAVGLTRGEQLRLSEDSLAKLRRFAEEGATADAPFAPSSGSTRRERAEPLGLLPPRQLSPLWESVSGSQPEFRWDDQAVTDGSNDGAITGAEPSFEFMLLSQERKLVWKSTLSSQSLTYPADAPELEAGATYHWKVNRVEGEQLTASPYVSFRVLEASERVALERELSRSSQPLVRALLLDRWGLYDAAREELARLGKEHPQRGLADQLDQAMRTKQSAS